MLRNKVFEYSSNDEFDGIFSYLRKNQKDFLTEKFIAIITKSDSYSKGSCEENTPSIRSSLIDGNLNTSWGNEENDINYAYVIFKFQENLFSIQGISIKTMCCNPQEVVIEASNEESFEKNYFLTKISMDTEYHVYHSSFENYNKFQYIRIRMTQPNKCQTLNRMQLQEIELFGIIHPHYILQCTYFKIRSPISSFLFLIYFLISYMQ